MTDARAEADRLWRKWMRDPQGFRLKGRELEMWRDFHGLMGMLTKNEGGRHERPATP